MAVGQLFDRGHGRTALQYRRGRPVAAQWRLLSRGRRPGGGREPGLINLLCRDADMRGVHDLIFDGVVRGELAIPAGPSIRRAKEQVPAGASASAIKALCARWNQQAPQWSSRPGAGAALVVVVKGFRLAWIGVHITPGADRGFLASRFLGVTV
jgi:hypothetical protein